jgi:toxin YoeB
MGEFRIEITDQAKKDFKNLNKIGDKATLNKLSKIFEELKHHPKTGTGNPEMLKRNLKGYYSRRLNHKDRIIYDINDKNIIVTIITSLGHYDDK